MPRKHRSCTDPWLRACVRDGRLTLHGWSPRLMSGGPQRAALAPLADTGAVLADLRCDETGGRTEVTVTWVPAGAGSEEAAEVLVAWAARVGHVRVWLPDRVVDLSDVPPAGGLAWTTCLTCGLHWEDESPDFWETVRGSGHFPGFCPACNASLPEWVVADEAPAGTGPARRRRGAPA